MARALADAVLFSASARALHAATAFVASIVTCVVYPAAV
jgi:hypothetical protein